MCIAKVPSESLVAGTSCETHLPLASLLQSVGGFLFSPGGKTAVAPPNKCGD
jgi:hypothetical protein